MKKILALLFALTLISSVLISFAEDGIYTDTTGWKIEASSERPSSLIKNAFDGNTATYWHTNYTVADGKTATKDECPHTITVTFPNALAISGVRYIPKQITEKDSSTSGIWIKAEIYGTTDGISFEKLATKDYSVTKERTAIDTSVTKANYKAMKIVLLNSVNQYGTAAEIQFISDAAAAQTATANTSVDKTETKEEPIEEVKSPGAVKAEGITVKGTAASDAYAYENSWAVEASSALSSGHVGRVFDCDASTYWHSWYTAKDGKITAKDTTPYSITVVFPDKKSVSGIRYMPRQINGNDKSTSGIVLKASVYGSEDGVNYTKIKTADFTYSKNYEDRNQQTISFDSVMLKSVRFVMETTVSDYGTCAELEILKGSDNATSVSDVKQATLKNRKIITMVIDSVDATVKGEKVSLVKAPVIVDGRTLVPVRFVSEALGATVGWNGDNRTVSVMDGTNVIGLTIDSKDVSVNGKTVALDVPAMIIDNSTMVPIRFVSENLGANVSWNVDTRTVTIESDITIACWGDSLTIGDGATNSPYPTVVSKLSDAKVYNLGIGGESALTIASRQGTYDIVFTEDFTIPESGSVEIPLAEINGSKFLSTAGGGAVFPRQITGKWNPAYINNVEGVLSINVDTSVQPRVLKSVTFTRSEKGEATAVKKGDRLVTSASFVKADLNVIYIGCNGTWSEDNTGTGNTEVQADKLIAMIDKMIDNTMDPTKYIVVGFTFGDKDTWSVVDKKMADKYGEHFVSVKSYMSSEQALTDSGLTPTAEDKTDIAAGRVPVSLRKSSSDKVHLNDYGYTILGTAVYNRMTELGYLEK